MRLAILLLLLFFLSNGIFSQTEASSAAFIGVRAHAGFLWIHSKTLAAIGQPYPYGIEADWGKQFLSAKAWAGCNCFPRAGVALNYWNFDTPVLGHGLTAIAYFEPVYFNAHRVQFYFRGGTGLAFISTPFDSITNPLNQAYSTRIAFPLVVNTGLQIQLNPRNRLRLSLNYNHISNGGIRLPNKGLNYPSASIGLDRYIQAPSYPIFEKVEDRAKPEKRTRVYLGHFSALSQIDPVVPRQYYVAGFWAKYARYIGGKSALTGGMEYINDLARRNESRRWGIGEDHQQLAALAGHELWLGKVVFSQELGIYLYDRLDFNDPVYQRYALTYHFHPRILGGISLKAHRHVADFLDLRIGISL